jgi:F-type H+-transporting ATPase subunit gamma
MASTQELRRRIKSIGNTKQITKAMEMVAASKMRRAQEATLQTRAYAQQALSLLRNLASKNLPDIHPLLAKPQSERVLAVVITSDKGLCGGYNAQVLRKSLQFLKNKDGKKVELIVIGKQGERALRKSGLNIIASFTDFPPFPDSLDIAPIAKIAIDGFTLKEYEEVSIIYTNFISTIKQETAIKPVLPLTMAGIEDILEENELVDKNFEYVYEPGKYLVLEYILPRLTEMQFFHAVLESIASEQSARMMAMKSASDNANELIDDLKLTFNSLRQASITQELAEVSSGTEALKKK